MASYIIGISAIYNLLNNCDTDNTGESTADAPAPKSYTVGGSIRLSADNVGWNNFTEGAGISSLSTGTVTLNNSNTPNKITGTAPYTLMTNYELSLVSNDGITDQTTDADGNGVSDNNKYIYESSIGILTIDVSDSSFTYEAIDPAKEFEEDETDTFTVNVNDPDGNTSIMAFTFIFEMFTPEIGNVEGTIQLGSDNTTWDSFTVDTTETSSEAQGAMLNEDNQITGTNPLNLTPDQIGEVTLDSPTGPTVVDGDNVNLYKIEGVVGMLNINVSDNTFTYEAIDPAKEFEEDETDTFTVNVFNEDNTIIMILNYTFNFVMASE